MFESICDLHIFIFVQMRIGSDPIFYSLYYGHLVTLSDFDVLGDYVQQKTSWPRSFNQASARMSAFREFFSVLGYGVGVNMLECGSMGRPGLWPILSPLLQLHPAL